MAGRIKNVLEILQAIHFPQERRVQTRKRRRKQNEDGSGKMKEGQWKYAPRTAKGSTDEAATAELTKMIVELEREKRQDLIAQGVELVLSGMVGPDWRLDPNFTGTPRRVARMFQEMLRPSPTNWTTFPAKASDLVILRGHKVFAICPHHLQPVELRCAIGYIPNEITVGLSKLARVVEEQLTKPMLQEDLAEAVADSLDRRLKPKGVGVVLAGTHGCMRFRGVRSTGDVIVSVMKGVLLLNPTARQEFLQLVGSPESRA